MTFRKSLMVVLALVLTLVLAACGGAAPERDSASGGDGATTGSAPMPEMEAPEEAPMAEPTQMAMEESAPATDGDDAGSGAPIEQAQLDRKIVYTGFLQLRVENARDAANEIVGIAMRFGGYVSQTNLYETDEEGTLQGEVQIRVNSANYQEALGALRDLSIEVLTERSESADVTDQYVDVQARVVNLQRTEAEIQALLAESRQRGADTEDILQIFQELTNIREQIERYQGQLNVLDDQSSLATITISLVPPEAEVMIVEEGWSFTRVLREAARDFTRNLQGFAEGLTYFVIVTLPWLLFWGLILFVLLRLLMWLARRLGADDRRSTIPPLRGADSRPSAIPPLREPSRTAPPADPHGPDDRAP